MKKSRPVLLAMSVLAALDVIAVSSALGDILGDKPALIFVLSTKAVQTGLAFYVQNITVPLQDVAAYRTSEDSLIAGPATPIADGTPVQVQTEPDDVPGNPDEAGEPFMR